MSLLNLLVNRNQLGPQVLDIVGVAHSDQEKGLKYEYLNQQTKGRDLQRYFGVECKT